MGLLSLEKVLIHKLGGLDALYVTAAMLMVTVIACMSSMSVANLKLSWL